MRTTKSQLFETEFSDNYRPSKLERVIQSLETHRRHVIRKLLTAYASKSKSAVLVDLACGDGELLAITQADFASAYGFDLARNRILNARKRLKRHKQIKLKRVDLDQGIPLTDQSVHACVIEASLQYFVRDRAVLNEVRRILKRKGIFILQVPNAVFLPRRLAFFLGQLPKTSAFSGHGDGGALHYYNHRSLQALLVSAGFTVETWTNSGILAKARALWPSLLAADIICVARKK